MELFKLDINFAFLISQKALIVQDDKLLVLENMSSNSSWELPGGLLEMNEIFTDGLMREVLEETGLIISMGKLCATWDHWFDGFVVDDGRKLNVRILELAYICTKVEGDVTLSHEHQAYRWATKEELRNLPLSPNSDIAIRHFINE